MRYLQIVLLSFLIITYSNISCSQSLYAPTKDAYVNNLFGSSGSTTSMYSGRFLFLGSIYYTTRSVIEFDLSSIPENAIIKSATLKLYQSVAGSPVIYTARLKGVWYEDSITWANQPAYETSDLITASSVVSGWHTVDVKSHVQKMVAGVVENNGWILYNNNEATNSNTNKTFYTRENSIILKRPVLEVDYYIPITVTSATVAHESSSGSSDGAISPVLADGPGGLSYKWFNSAGTQISTNLNLTGVPYGWYGLEVSSSNTSDKFYYAFIVGLDCEKVNISFNPGPNYIDDAMIYDLNETAKTTNYGASYGTFLASNYTVSGVWFDAFSLIKFRLWMDSSVAIPKADLNLKGEIITYIARSNDAHFRRVSTDWNESIVTYTSQPSYTTDSIDVSPTTTNYQAKTVSIKDYWNTWKADNTNNFGALFELDLYNDTYSRQVYYSSDNGTSSNRPNIDFTIDLTKEPVSMVWDTVTQLGEIAIDLDKVCVKTAPYKYLISEDTIPDLGSLYTGFNDSIYNVFYGTSLDSTTFFDGSTNLTKSFTNLQSGVYFVAVFDSTWTRIVDEEILVHGKFELLSSVNLELNGNEISATSGDAYGSLNLYADDETDSELIIQFDNYDGTQYVGYSHVDSAVSWYGDLVYGFYAVNDTLYGVINGSLSGTYVVVDSNDVFSMSITDTILSFKMNGVIAGSVSLPTEYLYKVNAKVGLSTKLLLKPRRIRFKLPNYRFNLIDLQHLACDGTVSGSFEFSITPFFQIIGGGGPSYSVTYNITDELNNPVVSGSTTTTSPPVIVDEYTSLDPLMPGKYKINGTINGVAFTSPYYITLGYEANWNQVIDYDQIPNSFSLKRTIPSSFDYATSSFAGSKNFLNGGTIGWTEFSALLNTTGVDLVRFSTQNIGSLTPDFFGEDYIGYSAPFLIWDINGSFGFHMITLPLNSKIRIEFNTSNISVVVNGTPIITQPATSVNRVLRFQTLPNNNGFKDIITSFPCPVQSLDEMSHAELKRKLDGGFTYAVDGTLLFTFDEEYKPEATDVVKLNIYDDSYQPVGQIDFDGTVGIVGTTSDDYEFDDNKRQIDITGITGITLNEYYILEVITSKGEKLYLRFLYKS